VSIAIRLNAHRIRRWHLDFQQILQARIGENVSFVLEDGPGGMLSVDLLLDLEKVLYFHSGQSPIDIIKPQVVGSALTISDAELIINLSGNSNQAPDSCLTLTPLFEGASEEVALLGALIRGRSPVISVRSAPGQQITATAAPALDEAHSVRQRFELVARHTQRLLLRAVSGPPRADVAQSVGRFSRPGAWDVGSYAVGRISSAALKRVYQLCLYSPHWRVGWRFVDDGGVWAGHSLGGVLWNSIADPGYRFYADPFPISFQGRTFIFVEDFDHRGGKGIISAIPFGDAGQIGPAEPVLSEPWHLSYPYLFEHRGEVWMIPESSQSRKISLYRANPFPSRWTLDCDLIEDIDASDASLVQFEGKWWMFATVRDELGGLMDSLSLFCAEDLFGPWRPHPANPVLIVAAGARQAGQFHLQDGRLWRPVQDCRDGYGRALGLAEVTRLNEQDYAQVIRTVLRPDRNWPGRRVHTLSRFGQLECIDGSRNSPRFGATWLRET
jgi:hypothetical protein